MARKNFQGTGTEDDNKVIGNSQPEDLVGLFDRSETIVKEITNNSIHRLSGQENLIIINSDCIIVLPRTILYRGKIMIKNEGYYNVTIRGYRDSETIDGYVRYYLNTTGTVHLVSTSKVWKIVQYK